MEHPKLFMQKLDALYQFMLVANLRTLIHQLHQVGFILRMFYHFRVLNLLLSIMKRKFLIGFCLYLLRALYYLINLHLFNY